MGERRIRWGATAAAVVVVAAGLGAGAASAADARAADDGAGPQWKLLHSEDFSKPLPDAVTPWVRDSYENPFDDVMDDNSSWYDRDYGAEFRKQVNSFSTYRKQYRIGEDGWLTASLSARDWNKDGIIERPPSISSERLGDGHVAKIDTSGDHTSGAIFRPTEKLPPEYRVEYKLKTIDYGGKRNGTIFYDGKENGYAPTGPGPDNCKTQHPWGEGSQSTGWKGDPTQKWVGDGSFGYCDWQGVATGKYGYNGFHYMAIVDFDDPAPRNNHFWHYRRKVLMDGFAQHDDRVGSGDGGKVCDSSTGEDYKYRDSSYNTVNMWVNGLPSWKTGKGGLAGNSQLFMTSCRDGKAQNGLASAAELQPELMPNQDYTFAIERDKTGYTLEATGNFARVGQKTLRFHRNFVVDDVPIWHYNNSPEQYNGRYNGTLTQNGGVSGNETIDQWPKDSAYPDYFVIGDLYTNVYEGSARVADIKLFVPKGEDERPGEPEAPPVAGPAGPAGAVGPAGPGGPPGPAGAAASERRAAPVVRATKGRAAGGRLKVDLQLSERSQVTFTVDQRQNGRRDARGRCSGARSAKGRSCVRTVRRGSTVRTLSSGRRRVTLPKRVLGGASAAPGLYRITVRATNAAGRRSTPRTVLVRIPRR